MSHTPKNLTTGELIHLAELSIVRSRAWLDVFRERQHELEEQRVAFESYAYCNLWNEPAQIFVLHRRAPAPFRLIPEQSKASKQ